MECISQIQIMEFVMENKRVCITGEVLRFYYDENAFYQIAVSDIPWYSLGCPWKYEACQWILRERFEKENQFIFHYSRNDIGCVLTFSEERQDLRLKVKFCNEGCSEAYQFAGGITVSITGKSKMKVTIPHLIYNDNPSAAPDRIVAHIGKIPGEGTVVEEHRLPIPAANIEWQEEGGFPYLTLTSVPQVSEGREEEYWAIGVLKETGGNRMISTSGPLMFNGLRDVYYGGQCTPMPYKKGYRTLKSGEIIEKEYYLSWGFNREEGRGFQNLTEAGYRILNPYTIPRHSLKQTVEYKKNVLDSRFFQDADCCGYLTFGSANKFGNISGRPEYFLYGWTGQAVKLAWCDMVLGILTKEKLRLKRGMDVIDFFVRNSESDVPGLYRGYYVISQKQWAGMWNDPKAGLSSRIEGESLSDLLDAMLLLKSRQLEVPEEWERMALRGCAFLMDEKWQTKDGIYPLEWEVDGNISNQDISAAGMPCVQALVKAGEYFESSVYLDYAEHKYELYAKYHMETFERPFARATMDARCEDKEAGIYFFTTAAEIYKQTGKEQFRRWAELAGDWILTFVFFWETGFEKGTACEKNGFKTTGWPGVSVQNHHLDVFFPTYEMYEFGVLSGTERMRNMALHVRNALTYGICTKEGEWGYNVVGEQGEQYYQTNYFQLRYPLILKYLEHYRGGMQTWNPSWITAQVMSSALKFLYYT